MNADMSVFMAPYSTWIQQAYAQIETPIFERTPGMIYDGLRCF